MIQQRIAGSKKRRDFRVASFRLPAGPLPPVPTPIRISVPSILSAGGVGIPSITGGAQDVRIYLCGKDVTNFISLQGIANQGLDASTTVQPLQITSQTLGRWTAQFDFLDLSMVNYPEIGQTFKVTENGKTLISGGVMIVQVDRWAMPASQPIQCYHVTAQDYSAICDRRIVNATYPAGSDIAGIVLDIWANVLGQPNEGITANNVPPIGGVLGTVDNTEIFSFVTVTQAYNQLATDTGCVWWIDSNADIHFVDYTSLPVCPFGLSESIVNYRALSASATLADYRNVQYVTSNLAVIPGVAKQQQQGLGPGSPGYGGAVVTETYTVQQSAAAQRALLLGSAVTQFPILSVVSFTVDSGSGPVAQAVLNGITDAGFNLENSWWFYAGFNLIYPPSTQNNQPGFPPPPTSSPFPNIGDVVVISYIPVAGSGNAVIAQGSGPFSPVGACGGTPWGSGTFESVQQVRNINLQSDLNAIAQAILNRSDFAPIQVQFETDEPGAAVGQSIPINLPISFLPNSTQWNITSVQMTLQTGVLEFGTAFRSVIQATSGQDLGNAIYWQERLIQRTENPLPVQGYGSLTFALAVDGGSLAAGVPPNNPVPLITAGPLLLAYVMAGTPPAGQSLSIDILDNGSSILAGPLVIPDGSFAQVLTLVFKSPGLSVSIGDVVTVNATYSGGGTAASAVTVFISWLVQGVPQGQTLPGVYQQFAK